MTDANYTATDGSLWIITHEWSSAVLIRVGPGHGPDAFDRVPKPGPLDWEWVADEYDGPGDTRHGNASTREEAISEIEAWILDDREMFDDDPRWSQ